MLQRSMVGSERMLSYHSCLVMRSMWRKTEEAAHCSRPEELCTAAAASMHNSFHYGYPRPEVLGERGWRVASGARKDGANGREANLAKGEGEEKRGKGGGENAASQASHCEGV